jgi:hypothetical protein
MYAQSAAGYNCLSILFANNIVGADENASGAKPVEQDLAIVPTIFYKDDSSTR